LLGIAAAAVFFGNLPRFLHEHHLLAGIVPKHWVIVFMLLSVPLLIWELIEWRLEEWPILLWCFGYMLISIGSYFIGDVESETAWHEIRLRFQQVILIVSLVLTVSDRTALPWVRRTAAICCSVGAILNIYEFFNPLTFSLVSGRSSGLYGEPNQAAIGLILGMVMSITVIPNRCRSPFVLLASLGIVTTMSRGGILTLFLVLSFFLFARFINVKKMAIMTLVGIGLIGSLFLPEAGFYKNVEKRIDWFLNPSIQSSPYSDDSNGRIEAALNAWNMFSESPILGNGVGTHWALTGAGEEKLAQAGAHNMYLAYMVDHGTLGILIFPLAVFAAIWRAQGEARQLGVIFAIVVLCSGFFSHNLVDDMSILSYLALMSVITALSREEKVWLATSLKPQQKVDSHLSPAVRLVAAPNRM
jgi:O-antigen ligase